MVTKRETPIVIKKGWGHELIWESNEKYCGKMLTLTKEDFVEHQDVCKADNAQI